MRQSNLIFGALALAFVVYITTRGSLPVYLSVIFGTASAPNSDVSGSNAGSGSVMDAGKSYFDFLNPMTGGPLGFGLRNWGQ